MRSDGEKGSVLDERVPSSWKCSDYPRNPEAFGVWLPIISPYRLVQSDLGQD